jgi:D-hydroxyproline dehydrogenase subunit gamma
VSSFRTSVQGEPRGPLCGMGVCFECCVTINGIARCRSCLTLCEDGMEVRTDG